jgi:non-specific protein-tyrosine kinase
LDLLKVEEQRLRKRTSAESVDIRQTELQTKRDALVTKAALTARGDNFTVSGAPVPTAPAEPRPIRDLLIALALGLILGLAVAFTKDYFDDTLRTKEELDRASGGLPVLALVPVVPGWRDRNSAVLESLTHPRSATAEAYRSLRTALAFAGIERTMKIIQVTSSTSGEGKTTTAANLAVTLAEAGKKVILVDCDLRRPRVHEFFNLENHVGYADVLLGTVSAESAMQVVETPGLSILPAGPQPPNPSELLSTAAARDLLEKLAADVDHVIVDSPPLIPVTDSSAIALYVDALILLVAAKATSRRSLHRSLEILDQIDAPLEGLVFNRVGREATYGYGTYTYTYGGERRQDRKPSRALSR